MDYEVFEPEVEEIEFNKNKTRVKRIKNTIYKSKKRALIAKKLGMNPNVTHKYYKDIKTPRLTILRHFKTNDKKRKIKSYSHSDMMRIKEIELNEN